MVKICEKISLRKIGRVFQSGLCATFIFVVLIGNSVYSQSSASTTFQFVPLYKKHPLQLESSGDSLKISTLIFYISNINFLLDNKVVYTEPNSFHLIDASLPESMLISLTGDKLIDYKAIQFQLGIDSITNVAGAMGGDLDPTKGMYWTWQSGYINFKLEGTSAVCPARNNEFQFHLGGYQAPFNTLQTIQLKAVPQQKIFIYFEVDKFFNEIELTKHYQVMSPSNQAVAFSKIIADCFYTKLQ